MKEKQETNFSFKPEISNNIHTDHKDGIHGINFKEYTIIYIQAILKKKQKKFIFISRQLQKEKEEREKLQYTFKPQISQKSKEYSIIINEKKTNKRLPKGKLCKTN